MRNIHLTDDATGRNPFKVPEGYFEDAAARIMASLPQKAEQAVPTVTYKTEKVTLFTRIKPYLYLAATICGLAFGVKVYEYQQHYLTERQPVAAVQITDEDIDEYVNEVCDFAMLDAQDIYAYATTGE